MKDFVTTVNELCILENGCLMCHCSLFQVIRTSQLVSIICV